MVELNKGPQSEEIPDLTEGQPDCSFIQRHSVVWNRVC